MKRVKVLVLTGHGLNCDWETAYAFTLAGAEAKRVHINALVTGEEPVFNYNILAFGGGFAWGDDHGAGVIHALVVKKSRGQDLMRFIQGGGLVMGICNGFQALVNLGLLPGFEKDYSRRSVALVANDAGNFIDTWVKLKVNPDSPCVFTKGLTSLDLPVRHGEGKFYAEQSILKKLDANKQNTLFYADETGQNAAGGVYPQNPNGSLLDIAGISDETGRVFGLMPHPEAYNHVTNHPHWAREQVRLHREGKTVDGNDTPGIAVFKNAVKAAQDAA